MAAIRAERHALDRFRMPFEQADLLPRFGVPNLHRSIDGGARQAPAVRTERNADQIRARLNDANGRLHDLDGRRTEINDLAVRWVPDLQPRARAGRRDERAVRTEYGGAHVCGLAE